MSENMKSSGITWIGDIPESWSFQPLKYISNCNQKVISETTPPTFTFSYVDIISTVRTYLKAIAYVENSSNIIASTGFAVYTPGEKLYPKYLYYFCISEGFVQEVDKFSYGIAYPAINTEILSKIAVAYPELSEQTLIADFLDEQCKKIDDIAIDIEKQIEILQKYKKSLITERTYSNSLGWIQTKIKYIGEIRGRIGFRGYTVEDEVKRGSDGRIEGKESDEMGRNDE